LSGAQNFGWKLWLAVITSQKMPSNPQGLASGRVAFAPIVIRYGNQTAWPVFPASFNRLGFSTDADAAVRGGQTEKRRLS
jgi:hypothetical protein